ncbi:MAG TPA: hypothetical protein PK959_06690 [Candidatus Competibacteraceae bacterium]|nr:hypothetical protein [Candidatus Competibacteraceae bacterium]
MIHAEPDSGRTKEEIVLLRRELDRQYIQRLQRLEDRLELVETQNGQQFNGLEQQINQVSQQLRDLSEQQSEQAPLLVALNRIVQSGLVLRWMLVGVMGLLAALATLATVWEGFQKWIR